jgi:two-component system, NarL family, sensor histidine kinase UhpB
MGKMGVCTQGSPRATGRRAAGRLGLPFVSATTQPDDGLPGAGATRSPRLFAADAGLYARVFVVNASILTIAVLLLIVTPIRIDPTVTRGQLLVLLAGLVVMLASNAVLLRFSMAPLGRLMGLMRSVDVLQPGRRLDVGGSAEVAEVIAVFNATLDRLEEERRSSVRRVLSAQEAERRRIARELHDQIGQNLTAVVLELKRLHGRVEPAYADTLTDAQELARESLDELRRISYELRPAALDDLGLASALSALATGIARRAGIAVTLDVDVAIPPLSADAELAVYRVAQEALTNAVRHSGCTRAHLRLAAPPGRLVLQVSDDGRGLGDGPLSGGGIRGMRERALTVGGRLLLGVGDRGGLEVELDVPLPADGAA